MKTSSSAGIDDFNSKVLKFCIEELSLPLTEIVNQSLLQGNFPIELKCSKVYPLHKQGKKDDLKNYRPISLVPTVSKIIEKAVLSRLLNHLKLNNCLPTRQHGFLPGMSTTTALVELVEQIIDHLEAGNAVSAVFLDLSKAFDCLDHNLILTKLNNLGVRGVALQWFRNYLSERTQVVEVKEVIKGLTKTAQSKPKKVIRGVPQGSVLGPVLFVLFTSDFPKYMEPYSQLVMFADDTVLINNSNSAEALEIAAYVSTNMAHDFCIQNDLVFNEKKTNQMILGRHKDLVSGLPNIDTVECTKHLGVFIDARLSWNFHIDSLCLKLNTSLYILRRIKTVGTDLAAITAYHSLFEAHIRYGLVLWGGSSDKNLQRVLVVQKQALRIMGGLHPQHSCREVFKEMGLLTVVSMYVLEVILHSRSRDLPRNGNINLHQTRRANDFSLPAHRTSLFSKKPSYSGAKLYNLLPADMKTYDFNTLKRKLKTWLLEETLYSLEEFETRLQRLRRIN